MRKETVKLEDSMEQTLKKSEDGIGQQSIESCLTMHSLKDVRIVHFLIENITLNKQASG